MTLKNNIEFKNLTEASNCADVMLRLPNVYDKVTTSLLYDIAWKLRLKEPNEDGTIRVRIPKSLTEKIEHAIENSLHSVNRMYKKEYYDAYCKLIKE
tara:strand:- start:357 stop:647 length:291 start_codon:yes stop_codon:yes gene_type:complete